MEHNTTAKSKKTFLLQIRHKLAPDYTDYYHLFMAYILSLYTYNILSVFYQVVIVKRSLFLNFHLFLEELLHDTKGVKL